ncbi:MAG: MerR family transcriptional regulator [Thermoanaerobaculia bacterium]|nr:MAG: MerR family transcriptional regulator [Thermoanaerobaculia bacterium]
MKRSYKLADVCKLLDLPPYVLRYWETEFAALQVPGGRANGPGRAFSAEEVAVLRRIKQLLYEEGYTIAGAKKKLESEPQARAEAGATGPLFAAGEAEAGTAEASPETARAEASPRAPVAALDSASGERIESLERGVADALKEARAILSLLDKHSR